MKNRREEKRQFRISFMFVLMVGCIVLLSIAALQETYAYGTSTYSNTATTSEQIHDYFPESYWEGLDALLEEHPNWGFTALYTDIDWEESFAAGAELYPTRNLLQWDGDFIKNSLYDWPSSWYSTTIDGSFSWSGNVYNVGSAPNWVQASEEAIRYCMDPRNFLDEKNAFMFEDQSYYKSATLTEVEAVFASVSGSDFWVKPASEAHIRSTGSLYNGELVTYAQAVYEIGMDLKINPVILASRIIQEQGLGQSALISGTYAFYPTDDSTKRVKGYYNYFNMGATDGNNPSMEAIIVNGLREAYQGGWNSRYKALYGGAVKFKAAYIARYQTTYYLQKFNVDTRSGRVFWGQYMQSLTTPQREASHTYNSYVNNGTLDKKRRFIIPVYNNMPEKAVSAPTKDGNPNYKLSSIYIDGSKLSGFKTDKTDYSIEVDEDTSVLHLTIKAYAPTTKITVNGSTDTESLKIDVNVLPGDNEIKIVSKAQNGDKRTYTIKVYRYGHVTYGDVNSDGSINSLDLAYMTSHVLGRNTLKQQMFEAADISGDGSINSLDIAYLTSYLLGKIREIPQR